MLISQSLFIDSEYKVDCENKINYMKMLAEDGYYDEFMETNKTGILKRDKSLQSNGITNQSYLNKHKILTVDEQTTKIIKEY